MAEVIVLSVQYPLHVSEKGELGRMSKKTLLKLTARRFVSGADYDNGIQGHELVRTSRRATCSFILETITPNFLQWLGINHFISLSE